MYLGVDLGGTNIAAALVDESGRILTQKSVPTPKGADADVITEAIAKLCVELSDGKEINAVGIGCPGTVDTETGEVVYANNINMEHYPICQKLTELLNLPVFAENDANAAAYGEYVAVGDCKNVVFVTIGTGIGSGIIIDGKLYRGSNCAGAELGHTVLVKGGKPCTCGRLGCFEVYASATAMTEMVKSAAEKHPDSLLTGKPANAKLVFDSMAEGDKYAKEIFDEYIGYLAEGLCNIVNIFQPEKLIIGGGMSKQGEVLLNPLKELIYKGDYNKYLKKTEIVAAKLCNDAGLVGAAMVAKAALES